MVGEATIRREGAGRRHCMVVHAYYPLGETRVQREALALIDRGYEVDVVCLRGPGEPAQAVHDGVAVHRLPVGRHRGRGMFVQLLEYLVFLLLAGGALTARHLRRRYDSVQVHNLPDFLVFAALVPKLTRTPVILDLHDLMPEFLAARTGMATTSLPVRLVRLQERVACGFADHVITVTDAWRSTLIARGVPAGKVSVVMNVADRRIFSPGDRLIGEPPAGDGFHLVYHGTFTHRYGVDLILDAVGLLRDEVPGLTLTLLGAGDGREELVARRAELGLEACVAISDDMVDASELPARIRTAHAGVVPNRSDVFTDGLLPTKLLEYVAMGTPVIAARTPTIASYFDDDMVAFFEPGNAAALADVIRSLAEDRGRLGALAENAAAFNHKYDWESTAEGYAAVLESLIGGASGDVAVGAHGQSTTASSDPAPTLPKRPRNLVRISTEVPDPAWDAFLAALPGGNHTQSSLWAEVKAAVGWQVARVVVGGDDGIAAGAQILFRQIGAFGTIGYVSRGPVLATPDTDLADRLMDELERAARSLRIRHLTVQPPGDTPETPGHIGGRGYVATATEVAPRATLVVDVTRPPDALLAGMHRSTRRNIRIAERRGVVVREGGRGDLEVYYRMLEATSSRRGFQALPYRYFEEMWRVLSPGGHLRLVIAEVDGQPVSGQIAVALGDTVVNKLSVWSGGHRSAHPNAAIQWSTMAWAHSEGYARYDLEGIELAAATELLAGRPLPQAMQGTVTSFKLGFGGEVVAMPQAYVHLPSKTLRWAYSEVYPRVVDNRSFKRIVKRLRTGRAPRTEEPARE